MSKTHLRHKLPWEDLLYELAVVSKDNGIELPVGSCGFIHCRDRTTELQVNHRKYLANQVCRDTSCTISGTKIFRKSKKISYSLNRIRRQSEEKIGQEYANFMAKLKETIQEFALSERKKIDRRVSSNQDALRQQVSSHLEQQGYDRILQQGFGCDCYLFTLLMELGDSRTLLSFSDNNIRSVLQCMHGGQAVGNNIRFFLFQLFRFYVTTNLIIAGKLQDKPDQWGCMRQNDYFRSSIQTNCDGQTFLSLGRHCLQDDVYILDVDATQEVLKQCFKVIYLIEMLNNEIGSTITNQLEYYIL